MRFVALIALSFFEGLMSRLLTLLFYRPMALSAGRIPVSDNKVLIVPSMNRMTGRAFPRDKRPMQIW